MAFLDAFLAPWTNHPSELRELRLNMASTKDMVARLSAATDEIANDLADFRAKVADQDASLAAELDPLVTRLEQMGQDPKDPVPDVATEPTGTSGEPFDGPGTGTTPAQETADDAPVQSGDLNDGEVSPETVPDER